MNPEEHLNASGSSLANCSGDIFYMTSANKNDPEKFLSTFYNKGQIPNFVIDRIIKFIDIDDFRINKNRLIKLINEQMNEDSTAADFKRNAWNKLVKTKDQARRTEVIWGFVQEINV